MAESDCASAACSAGRSPDRPAGGLAIAVTATLADTRKVLHVSLSQAGHATTGAVAQRFGFFLVTMLNRNALSLDPFFSETGVHHLHFAGDTPALVVNDFDSTWEVYRTQYRPLPFTFRAQAG